MRTNPGRPGEPSESQERQQTRRGLADAGSVSPGDGQANGTRANDQDDTQADTAIDRPGARDNKAVTQAREQSDSSRSGTGQDRGEPSDGSRGRDR